MRLIELRLKNLNSLKGEWHIDFADSAFINEGIFAITGQTGAGKTTILDAICLALYGETPRITTISKSSNEVMTRQTSECFAEVVIDLNGSQYRCRWGQRRAYGKADGNLQDATHEIALVTPKSDKENNANDKGDEILESKLSRTKDKIIALTRMDFQQFTRSILLAQGSFSAFLKAKADERADILEKITGTDIYATISAHVFEKKRAEEEILSKLQFGLDGLTLLAPDEEILLRENLTKHQAAQSEQQQRYQRLSEQINWLEAVAELENNITNYQQDLTTAKQAQTDFIPDAKRLIAANKALEIDSQYSQIIHHRNSVKRLQDDQQTLNQQLPNQENHLTHAAKTLQASNTRLQMAYNELQTTLPKIGQARKLDATIAQQSQSLEDNRKRQETVLAIIQRLHQEIEQHKNRFNQDNSQLTAIENHLSDAAVLQDVDTDTANFDSYCSRLKALLKDNAALAGDKASHHHKMGNHQANLDNCQKQHESAQSLLTKSREALSILQNQQTTLTQAQSLADIRAEQEQIEHIRQQIEKVDFKGQQLSALTAQIDKITSTLPAMNEVLTNLAMAIEDNQSALIDKKQQRQDKQQLLDSWHHAASLERYITQLTKGNPCPLCGALEHPYSEHHPELDKKQSEVNQTQQQISKLDAVRIALEQTLSKQQIEYATTQNQIEQLHEQKIALHEQTVTLCADIGHLIRSLFNNTNACAINTATITKIIESIGQIGADINLLSRDLENDSADFNLINGTLSALESIKNQLVERNAYLKNILTQHEALSDELVCTRKTIETYDQQQYQLARDIHELQTHIQIETLAVEGIDNKIWANFTELAALKADISAILNKYLAGKFDVETETLQLLMASINEKMVLNEADYHAHIHTLRQQRSNLVQLKQQFTAYKNEQQNLVTALASIKVQIDTKQEQLDKEETELYHLNQAATDKTHALNNLSAARQAIFVEKTNVNPDEEEARLRAAVEQANNDHTLAQRQLDGAEHTLKQFQQQQFQLTEQLSAATSALTEQDTVFQAALISSDFIDEADFMQARLPAPERHSLTVQQQQISDTLKQAQSLLAQTRQALAQKRAEPLTTDDKEALVQQQYLAQHELHRLIETIGAMSQQLKDNEEKKGNQQSQRQAIAEQKENLQVWRQLNELIGSSSGKKYRTFAQGLTFDIMVTHANAQLHKMSDRYLLTRDDNNPLELNVIDNYQGGEVRSTKNLSGGEGFIISLALALGLSKMASHNIRVDSLFLDEGFGTLDEESLDIALDTLTNLQQEGKLIGVISHVQALKERILTQIQVNKLSGGFSKITGQGCYHIAS